MISAIAVDDEPVALDIIKTHAVKVPFINLRGVFLSAIDALAYIKKEPVDLVFLDISMPDISGLEFAEIVKHQTQVVFTTAYPEHALKGFELAATDYLLKPINFNRFLQACHLAEARVKPSTPHQPERESLFVKDGHNWIQIKFNDILYIQGEDNYVSIFENNKRTLTRITLTELQSKLPADRFLRVHKSYIVAIAKIDKAERHQVIVNNIHIPVSRVYRDVLLKVVD